MTFTFIWLKVSLSVNSEHLPTIIFKSAVKDLSFEKD